VLSAEVGAIDTFLTSAFTDLISPALAAANVLGTTLSGAGVNFSDVKVGDYVYVPPTQVNNGLYRVTTVTSDTTLEVATPFTTTSSVNFRVVRPFGATEQTLSTLYAFRENTASYLVGVQIWNSTVTTPLPVLGDAGAFARGFDSSTLSARISALTLRQATLPASIQSIEGILRGGDRYYDRRYTWIDARINLEKGILVQQQRSVASRVKATAEVLSQLTKLLAVEG
jgi:hypothetical protein